MRERPQPPVLLRMAPILVGLSIIVAGVLLIHGDLSPSGGAGSSIRVGSPAPDFTLSDVDGKTVRLSDFRGQRVVLNFWATWCPPCRAEMPDLDAVAVEMKDRGVVVLAIDVLEPPETVRAYVEDLRLGLRPVLDRDGAVAELYRVNGYPTSFFVDSQGNVQDVHVGPLTRATTLRKLDRIK